MQLRRNTKLTVAAAIATAVAFCVGVGPVSAATGTGYDGTNPATTGCATGSYAIYSQNLYASGYGTYVGVMEVRYSPKCGTNWVRVYNQSTPDAVAKKFIARTGAPGLPNVTYREDDTGIGWSYGQQVYAPGSTCVWVQGGLVTGPWTAWSAYVQIC